MANLKADLDNYLKKSNSSSSSLSLSSLTKSFTLPSFKSPFALKDPQDTEVLIEDGGGGGSKSWWHTETGKDSPGCMPSLSKKQRIVGFMGCIFMGVLCFSLSAMYFPVLILRARKFALLYSMGSLFTLSSFSFLWGPLNHLKHLVSQDRLLFTSVYLVTLFGTLYFALGLQNTVFTCIAAVCQVVALVWFVMSYIPGGQTGLKFLTKICSNLCCSAVGGSSFPV